ncbi:hypothetical protein I203_101496 [Kwoniella mangroviensis CBS 8507]|uniref:uncharacterized protein n=1 Tax=Kwoniella mangroviensis CBS 8507 TaxID=1296122 RepID=UPI00080D4711|nr:uncharacterized protein I203_05548 [Kwoniella mangroviensis CBS 8507]OCF65302.1 hypothetical protein I203_05548 [Kwoniella mangroviensis CBS 8507]
MSKMDKGKAPAPPSSNWAKLQKTLPGPSTSKTSKQKKSEARRAFMAQEKQTNKYGVNGVSRYIGQSDFTRNGQSSSSTVAGPSKITIPAPSKAKEDVVLLPSPADSPLVEELRVMVSGKGVLNESRKAPGNYIAIDCEMVGTGPNGSESCLARVSIVNFHGHILLDTFVQPREKVTDWRTWISGVRESDMIGAPSFEEVQKKVAELCEGRIVVGHAVDNDLKILLLSHPSPLIRDTQRCKMLREKAKSKHPGLKKLSEMELGIRIQQGSHSSVTDARATMGLYRLHKVEWEKQLYRTTEAYRAKIGKSKKPDNADKKRKRDDDDDGEGEDEDEVEVHERGKKGKRDQFPGGGRKGISSGLGLIVRKNGKRVDSGGGFREEKRNQPATSSVSSGNWWESVDE